MKIELNIAIIVMASAVLSSGCTLTRHITAHLQDRQTGQIKTVNLTTKGRRSGTVEGVCSDGEQFKGTYGALVDGAEFNRYQQGHFGPWQYEGITASSVSDSNADVTFMATGNRGTSLVCRFTSNRSLFNPTGRGECADSNNRVYNMMFIGTGD